MSPDKVLKIIKDKEIDYVDFRFTDPKGKLQHVTMDKTAVDENMLNSISIFPNPVKDILYLSGTKGGEEISIYSSNGQQVHSETLTGNSNQGINLSSLPKGIYQLQINDGTNNFYKKLIK